MTFSRKIWLMIKLKVTKNQGFILSLGNTFLEKPQGGRRETELGGLHKDQRLLNFCKFIIIVIIIIIFAFSSSQVLKIYCSSW